MRQRLAGLLAKMTGQTSPLVVPAERPQPVEAEPTETAAEPAADDE